MEIGQNDGNNTEEDLNSKFDVCSESRDHEGFDNSEPNLEEILPPDDQVYPNSIVDDLYNQLEVEKDNYKCEIIVDHYFKDGNSFLKTRYVGDALG